MKFHLEVPDSVLEEVTDAVQYYDHKQTGLGDKLYDDFENALVNVEKNPLLFQEVHKNYRHIMLNQFPYLLVFRIYGTRILVNKFIHAKKQPAKRYK